MTTEKKMCHRKGFNHTDHGYKSHSGGMMSQIPSLGVHAERSAGDKSKNDLSANVFNTLHCQPKGEIRLSFMHSGFSAQ